MSVKSQIKIFDTLITSFEIILIYVMLKRDKKSYYSR